jgi:hypothetical protein
MARIIRLGRLDSEFCCTISLAQILRFVALSVLPFTGTFCLVNVLSPLARPKPRKHDVRLPWFGTRMRCTGPFGACRNIHH